MWSPNCVVDSKLHEVWAIVLVTRHSCWRSAIQTWRNWWQAIIFYREYELSVLNWTEAVAWLFNRRHFPTDDHFHVQSNTFSKQQTVWISERIVALNLIASNEINAQHNRCNVIHIEIANAIVNFLIICYAPIRNLRSTKANGMRINCKAFCFQLAKIWFWFELDMN